MQNLSFLLFIKRQAVIFGTQGERGGVFTGWESKQLRGWHKVHIPKLWGVGEHKRRINRVCLQPKTENFLNVNRFQWENSNHLAWERVFHIVDFGDSKIAKLTSEKE